MSCCSPHRTLHPLGLESQWDRERTRPTFSTYATQRLPIALAMKWWLQVPLVTHMRTHTHLTPLLPGTHDGYRDSQPALGFLSCFLGC